MNKYIFRVHDNLCKLNNIIHFAIEKLMTQRVQNEW